jgi:AAA+ ATPase superfamily predicted ATPase
MKFVGRKSELKLLRDLKDKSSASLAVISGRRRIGKSRLAEEFGKSSTYFSFSGLPPSRGTTAKFQRKTFALQLEKYFNVPIRYENWYELFQFLAEQTRHTNCVILFDEISWMGSKDPEFLAILKTVWDLHFKKNDKLVLILCGSVSYWITKNILSSTGFVGRVSLHICLKELSLKECAEFWDYPASQISAYEILKVLACIGGIPRYLEEINPKEPAEVNIKRLCFNETGPLYNEFEQIFSDLFNKRAPLYKNIILSLVEGPVERNEIAQNTDLAPNRVLTEYLEDLIQAGFIQRDFIWNFKPQTAARLSKYRISDNYIRFYLKYIDKIRGNIEKGQLDNVHLATMSGWYSMIGLQMENLILNNRTLILKALHIPPEIVVNDGPYFQRKTVRLPGCQIDYLIQTKLNELYVGEVKFSQNDLKPNLIEEVKSKISRFKYPKNFSVRPFLIHMNSVTEKLEEENYFTKIINLQDLLSQENA